MKKFLSFSLFALCSLLLKAQTQNPVTWTAHYAGKDGEGEIVILAKIENGWHTYSQRPVDDGPIPTSVTIPSSAKYELKGKVEESEAHEEFVKAFDAKIFVFTGKAEFRQKIRLKTKEAVVVPVKVEFMSCNDMMCLPPRTVELQVRIQ